MRDTVSIVMSKTESLLSALMELTFQWGDTQLCLVGLRKAKLGKGIEMKEEVGATSHKV